MPLVRFADRVRSIAETGIDAYPPRLEALKPFDEIVSWYGTNRPEFRDALSRYPVRFLDAIPPTSGPHAIDFYMAQVGGPLGAVPRIDCIRDDQRFIAVHPFSGSARKNWRHFSELAALVSMPVRFFVSPEQIWSGAAQHDDLYILAQSLAKASLYIGNDSGITHLAAAVGVPVIAIFQASDPKIWAPRGIAAVDVLENPSLETVLATVQSRLHSR
jgi:heptosyltransferase-3